MSATETGYQPKRPTERQREVITFIAAHQRVNGQPPTWREIATHLGVSSTNGITDHVNTLIRDGWLTRAAFAPVADRFIDERYGVRGDRRRPIRLTEAAMTLVFGPPCKRCNGTGRRR